MWEKLSNGVQSVSLNLSVGNRRLVVNEAIIGNRMARYCYSDISTNVDGSPVARDTWCMYTYMLWGFNERLSYYSMENINIFSILIKFFFMCERTLILLHVCYVNKPRFSFHELCGRPLGPVSDFVLACIPP